MLLTLTQLELWAGNFLSSLFKYLVSTLQDIFLSDIWGLHVHRDGLWIVPYNMTYTFFQYAYTHSILSLSFKSLVLSLVYWYPRLCIMFLISFSFLQADSSLGVPFLLFFGMAHILLLPSCTVDVSNKKVVQVFVSLHKYWFRGIHGICHKISWVIISFRCILFDVKFSCKHTHHSFLSCLHLFDPEWSCAIYYY